MTTNISSLMTKNPITLLEDDTLNDVMSLMNKSNLSHLLITRNDDILSGIISKKDILQRLKLLLSRTGGQEYNKRILNTTLAKEVMTAECFTLNPDDAPEYAVELLLQGKFHALPVVENDKLIGIVSFSDLLKTYYQTFA